MAMAGTSMAKATMVSGIAERSVSRTPVSSSPSAFLGRSVRIPRAALPVRRFRTQSIRADVRDPVDGAKEGAKQTADDAQKLAKEGASEAKDRTTDAAKDFGSSVQNTTDEMQRAASDTGNRLKQDAKDVTEPADDLLAKTRQEGREAFAEMGDVNKDAKDRNLGVEIQGSAGNALADGLENVQNTAKKAGSAVSESAQRVGKDFADNVSQGLSEAGDRLKGATGDVVQDTKDFVDADGAKQRLKEGQDLVGKNVDSVKKNVDEGLSK